MIRQVKGKLAKKQTQSQRTGAFSFGEKKAGKSSNRIAKLSFQRHFNQIKKGKDEGISSVTEVVRQMEKNGLIT
jgi:hypothetical protein